MKKLLGLLIVISVFVLAQPGSISAAALTSVSHYPSGTCGGGVGCQATYYYVIFTTATIIPTDGKIKITFPAGYNVSLATFGAWSGIDGNKTVSVNGQVVTVTRTGGGTASAAGYKYIRFTNITNPVTAGSYTVTVETTDTSDGNLDGPTESSSYSIWELANIKNVPLSLQTGQTTKQRVSFDHAQTIPANGKIVVTFPSGYDVSGATISDWSGFDGGYSISINGQTVSVLRDGTGTPITYGAGRVIRFANITNPTTNGTYSVTVETTQANDTSIGGPVDSAGVVLSDTLIENDPNSPWPTYGHDNQHTSRSTLPGPSYPTVQWKESENGYGPYVSLDSEGKLYTANPWGDRTVSLNSDGDFIWSFTHSPASNMLLSIAPVVANNGTIITAGRAIPIVDKLS